LAHRCCCRPECLPTLLALLLLLLLEHEGLKQERVRALQQHFVPLLLLLQLLLQCFAAAAAVFEKGPQVLA
jgi:hypothetical protein